MNEANKLLLEDIKELKEQHPAWGYRRVWAYLKYRKGLPVNHKRVYRLMKTNNLMVPRNLKLRSKREAKTQEPVRRTRRRMLLACPNYTFLKEESQINITLSFVFNPLAIRLLQFFEINFNQTRSSYKSSCKA